MLFFEGQYLDHHQLNFSPLERSAAYGDGFFETFYVEMGRIRLFDLHWQRMLKASETYRMLLPFSAQELQKQVFMLFEKSQFPQRCRMRLDCWRQRGGFYEAQADQSRYSLFALALPQASPKHLSLGLCEQIQKQVSPFVGFKTLSATWATFASFERKEKNVDDLLLFDVRGKLSECLYSNLFWRIGTQVFTPALSCACVAGIMRAYVLQSLPSLGYSLQEGDWNLASLLEADEVFRTNALGIQNFATVLGKALSEKDLGEQLRALLAKNT